MNSPQTRSTSAMRVLDWLERLDEHERTVLGRRYAQATRDAGAVVHKPDGTIVPIPPVLSPEAIDVAQRTAMQDDAQGLVRALSRLTAWLMSDSDGAAAARARLFASFGPLEREGLDGWRHAERLATARVDFFLDESGAARALEVNATIPAMQGYSDIIAAGFLTTVGRVRGFGDEDIDYLIARNGRNSDDLHDSLMAHYELLTGTSPTSVRILIVAREGDAQRGELEHYVRRWTELGHQVVLATPSQVRRDGDRLAVGEHRADLVYRHIFARRLDPASDFARACLRPDVFRILNPFASQLEVKGMLGHLSAAGDSDGADLARAIGLDDGELLAIRRALPWTRVLESSATRGPDGERVPDLARLVAAEPDRFVLKRSWDYGGKSVFLGAHHDDSAAARAAEVLGTPEPLSWPQLVAAAAVDPRDAWVVQGFVRTPPRRHLLAGPDGATWRDFYVDLSLYTNLGVAVRPSGGASRASAGRIVNILGGGGLAPLVREEVLDDLMRG